MFVESMKTLHNLMYVNCHSLALSCLGTLVYDTLLYAIEKSRILHIAVKVEVNVDLYSALS